MGTLFYVIGASGAGKDSLINRCRHQINGQLPIVFAHRYITRPIGPGAENHIYLSDAEFNLRMQYQQFAMNWESHSFQYGIGAEINTWLQKGLSVVVNGSRNYLKTALAKYPGMQVILIEAQPDIIKKRLQGRGRENDKSIEERIARNEQFNIMDLNVIRIQNNGTIADAANELLNTILQKRVPAGIEQ